MKTTTFSQVYGFEIPSAALACLLALFLVAPAAFGQCAATYGDASDDGVNVYAWSTLTDNHTPPFSSCAQAAWGSFTHSDTAEVTITSPSLRQSMFRSEPDGQRSGSKWNPLNHAAASNST